MHYYNKLDFFNRIIIIYLLGEKSNFFVGESMNNNSFNNFFLANFLKREKAQYDFEDKEFYMNLISFLLLAHILLEGLYIYSYCTPMVYINLASICTWLNIA